MPDQNQVPAQIFLQTGPVAEPATETGTGMDLSVVFDYLDMIRSRFWLFAAIPILFVAIAFFRVYTATPIYESWGQLQIQPRPLVATGAQSFYDPMAGARDFGQFINTEIELMRTPDVLNRAFEQLDLASDPAFATGNPVGVLARNLKISQKTGTFLINVSYRSEDPEKAARIANFLGELYVRGYQERKREISGGGISRLRDQLDKIATARDGALQALAEFKKEHHVMDLDYERELRSQRISALTESLIEAEMVESEARDAAETIEAWKKEGHLGVIVQFTDNEFARIFRLEQLRMQMDLPELLNKFGAGHSDVRTRQKIIDNLQNAVSEEIETSLVALHLKQKRAAKRHEVILSAIAELEDELMELDTFGAKYYSLKDTYGAAEAAYRKVIFRINDVDISVNTDEQEANDFLRVVRRAMPNHAAVWPRRRASLSMALVLGLALGGGMCILLGMLDTSVKSQSEIERCMKDAVFLGNVPARPDGQDELATVENSQGIQAEAFRSVRTSLSLCLTGREERCFMATSSGPGDGKTTVALNLAVALARDNRKVLLMECDMRRPRLKQVLGDSLDQADDKGLSKVLVGEIELKDATVACKHQKGLDVVLCGPRPPDPGELLGTQRFGEVLAQAKAAYDYVIIDTTPLLDVADAAVIAGHGVPLLCVVRLFSTTRHDLRLASERMHTIQARCAGVIVNQAEVPRHSRYGYYRRGHYAYYKKGRGYYSPAEVGPGTEPNTGGAQTPEEQA